MKKKRIAALCLILLAAAMITGCVDNAKSADNSSASVASSSASETDKSLPSGEEGKAESSKTEENKTQASKGEESKNESSKSEDSKAQSSGGENSKPKASEVSDGQGNKKPWEYDKLNTLEYNEVMLQQMNEEDSDFEVIHTGDEQRISTNISGQINTSPVKDEQDAIEQIKLIRSILGLVNPEQQLVFVKESSNESKYFFRQYYGGYSIEGTGVTVTTDDNGIIRYTEADIVPVDVLKSIQLDGLLSVEEATKIAAQDEAHRYAISSERAKAMIWMPRKNGSSPIVVYIDQDNPQPHFTSTIIINAKDGSVVDSWEDVFD